jgi:signal transduction histidine kinase
MSETTHPAAMPPAPSWLQRAYSYIGAHSNAMRFRHERDRALQRTVMPFAAVVWVIAYHGLVVGTPLSPAENAWAIGALVYSSTSAAFWFYLKRYPEGGVHIQYAFLAADPLIVGWALCASPKPMGWWLVLMLILVVRVGFRYGLNAMKAELVFAGLGSLIPIGLSEYWQTELHVTGVLVGMLASCYWLFAPLSRTLERARLLEVEQARVQSLQESLKAKSEFLSRVSHELKSPLQGIISSLDLIEERSASKDIELHSRIRRGTNALNAQIRDLLTLARSDAGRMEMNPMPFEATELMQSVAREVQPEAEANGLQIIVEIPEEPIFVVADPTRIDQVATNLLTNAVRHTRSGKIRLKLYPYAIQSRELRFEVSDSGEGIPEDRIDSLFEPYVRIGDITATGTGLGLSIVRSVLNFLDGKVSVKSELGRGTTFTVTVPAELVASESEPGTQAALGRILVVDDRPEVLEGIEGVVKQLGFECDTAASVGRATNLLGSRPYGTVFIDLQMPIKDGKDVAADVRRAEGPNKDTKIISISAGDMSDRDRGWPFDSHLTKPITMQAIRRVIGQRVPAPQAPRRSAST